MADNIRGLTVEISADATTFNKQMRELRSEAKSSQSELNALQKSLKLKFDSATFERAQKVAQQAIDETAKAAETLRARLAFLEQSGNADTTAYKKLQTELAQTELRAKQLEEQLDKINKIKFDAIAKHVSEVGNAISTAGRALTPFSAAAEARRQRARKSTTCQTVLAYPRKPYKSGNTSRRNSVLTWNILTAR